MDIPGRTDEFPTIENVLHAHARDSNVVERVYNEWRGKMPRSWRPSMTRAPMEIVPIKSDEKSRIAMAPVIHSSNDPAPYAALVSNNAVNNHPTKQTTGLEVKIKVNRADGVNTNNLRNNLVKNRIAQRDAI
jgi:hypothetical protein